MIFLIKRWSYNNSKMLSYELSSSYVYEYKLRVTEINVYVLYEEEMGRGYHMVYSKYGLTFRKIREQKKISLSAFPKIGISKAALSKFERGETMMGFENVVCALQEMGVSLEEYESFLNAYTVGEQENLWEEMEKATYQRHQERLQELQIYAQESGFTFIELAAKSCMGTLNTQEAEEITDYLYEIEIWSFTELHLFYFSMEYLNRRDIIHILDNFFPKGHALFNSKKHRQFLVRICCRAVAFFSASGYKNEAQMLLEQLEVHGLARTMFQRNLKNLSEGFWIHHFGNKEQGEAKLLESLEILRTISSNEEFSYYKSWYQY